MMAAKKLGTKAIRRDHRAGPDGVETAATLERKQAPEFSITKPPAFRRYRAASVQAQRIIANRTAPATSTTFTTDGHFSGNTFRMRSVLHLGTPPCRVPFGT
jgi:hypothetical protein